MLFFQLFLYFFVCFPLAQAFLKDKAALYHNWNFIFFFAALTVLFSSGKLNFSKVGIAKTNKTKIAAGLALGISPIISVVVLDNLLIISGLSENDLFSGACLRESPDIPMKTILMKGVLEPIVSATYITGYALNILTEKKETAIPVNGILYSMMNFNLGAGYLAAGMVAAGLARFTGSLIPAILFCMGCALAKLLVLSIYPRIATILVFLI